MSQSSPIPDATLEAVVYAAATPEPVKNHSEDSGSACRFLRSLFQLLNNSGVRYCVLHSWKELPEHLHTDLDMAVHPQDSSRLSWVFTIFVRGDTRRSNASITTRTPTISFSVGLKS